ncbi:MAG TPA: hypothetical protein VFB62_05680 [Polyangiaceae bacterium]|jgi:hypothetical protein|nr:hypothetical protein [Polyangiaceae bacterium]
MIVTCRELTEMSTDKKEGKLTRAQRLAVALHLAWCRRCKRYLEQVDLTVDALHRLRDEPVSSSARRALRARFRRQV